MKSKDAVAEQSTIDERNSPPIGVSDAGDLSDGREAFQWMSRWSQQARKEIRIEAACLFLIFGFSLFAIFATWQGWLSWLLAVSPEFAPIVRKYSLYASSGMLGGITFGLKFFYRAVARGLWHQDRRAWRFMSPFVAMAIAFVVGTLIQTTAIAGQKGDTPAAQVSIGFLAGYFADEAVGKLFEIASVIFGASVATKKNHGKKE